MKTAFLHANLIDVMEGKLIPNCTVLVEDGIIADILMDDSHPNDASVIDLEGRYLTPGFFDCHVHIVNDSLPEALSLKKTAVGHTLTALENLESLIKAGVTFARDVGDVHNIGVEMREAIKAG
ncbi:MAG: amidohydrolase family protein, partial [Lachnospiraceae bacterium]|nr:amidohydrolase family protein [Lachnospiraceae bacterium]